jgi:hypothetical protein
VKKENIIEKIEFGANGNELERKEAIFEDNFLWNKKYNCIILFDIKIKKLKEMIVLNLLK